MQASSAETLLDEVKVLKRIIFATILMAIWLGTPDLCFSGISTAEPHPEVKGTVEFRAIEQLAEEPWHSVIAGARILVIGPDGKLLKTGTTNQEGKWITRVTVPADQRFSPSRTLGTVTAIAVANGYIERLFFDVPVTEEGAVQVVALSPVKPHQRNEPGYELGMLHRLWVLPLLDHYAEQAGLGKQTSVEGDWNSPHWGPDLSR
jgi:hypothetical protein